MNRPEDPVSLNVFEQINSICKEFRRSRRSGHHPRIEDWLNRVSGNAQTTLFSNLLEIEINGRVRDGESPASDKYLKRFPQFASQIRQAFDESTMGSNDPAAFGASGDSAAKDTITQTFEIPAANRLGDYELIRELGRGGFGVVYEARHSKRGNRVALKTLPTGVDGQGINADRLHKFRKEFRSLSEINHPNLVGMQTLEVDGEQWFFTMDLIEGTDFLTYVRPEEKLNGERLRSALKQLAAGIIFLHEQGIVHRDLKPSNVLVDELGRVVILDFGLVAQLQTNTDLTVSRSGMFAGTPRYAAPEQMFGQRSEASDWYAFGTMLYESLTGQPPFAGRQMELLRQKTSEDPPSLVEQERTEAAEDLAVLTDGLLKREPSERFNTTQIIEALQLDLKTRSYRSTAGSKGSKGSTGSDDEDQLDPLALDDEQINLIGRDEQLAQLEAVKLELLEKREPLVVWITGKSGEGKSSLAEKFLGPLRLGEEVLVLSGRCYDRESVPFKAVDCWIDSLSTFLRRQDKNQLEEWLPQDIKMLAQIFPVLNRVSAIAAKPVLESEFLTSEKVRHRAFGALRELLIRISNEFPIVIFIDDLQWGDSDSVVAYQRLFATPNPPSILLLGSFRSDEEQGSPFLAEWDRKHARGDLRREIEVGPLSEQECFELVVARTDCEESVARKQVSGFYHETGGNPYFVEQLIEGFDSQTGTFRPLPISESIRSRLSRLPGESIALLKIVAVSGQAALVAEIGDVADKDLAVFETLTHMRNERLVRLIGSENQRQVDTFHDKIRESVLLEMPLEERQSLHRQWGEAIERQSQVDFSVVQQSCLEEETEDDSTSNVPRVFDLAYHFDEAGSERSLTYQVLAGEEALRAFANDEAIVYLQKSKKQLLNDAPAALRYRIYNGLGQAFLGDKQARQAIRSFETAVQTARSPIQKAAALTNLGKAYAQIAHVDEAVKHLDLALAEMGVHRPRTFPGKVGSFVFGMFRTLAFPLRWNTARTDEKRAVASARSRVLRSLSNELLEKDFPSAVESFTREIITHLQTGQPELVLYGYVRAAVLCSGLGSSFFGSICLKRSQRQLVNWQDPALIGFTCHERAGAHYFLGEFKDAEQDYERAIPLLKRSGELERTCAAIHLLRHTHAYISSSAVELDTANQVLELAKEIGNKKAICWGSYDCASALARRGRLSDALSLIQQAFHQIGRERWYLTEANCGSCQAYVLLQSSAYAHAREASQTAWETVNESWFYSDWSVLCLPILIQSIVGPTWTKPISVQSDRKTIKKLCRRVGSLQKSYPGLQPRMFRSIGRVYCSLGWKRKAIKSLERAIQCARKRDMGYDCATALLDLAAVKEENRKANRVEAIELLKKMESVIPRAESWILGDQYDEAVVAPEFDLKAWEQENGKISSDLEARK